MRKKLSLCLVIVLSLATMLCGCSGEDASINTTETVAEEEATTDKSEKIVENTSEESAEDVSDETEDESDDATDEWTTLDGTESDSEEETEVEDGEADYEADIPETSNTVHVKTAAEFLEAISSDTTIVLEKGKYNLTEAIEETDLSKYARYLQPNYGYGEEIVISDVDNMVITGPADGVAEIVIEDATAAPLSFRYCNDIAVTNVTVGHEVEKGTCSGSVIRLEKCINVTLNDDDLYGCGTYGIEATKCSGIRVNNSTIRECTYGIVSVYLCSDTIFNNCTLKECDYLDLIDATDSSIVFNKCDFTGNNTEYDFAKRYAHSAVIFKGCSFGAEETDRINELSDVVGACYFDEDCTFDGRFLANYVTVSTAKEFLEALKPGATICVEPGTYNLTECILDILEDRGDSWVSTHKYIYFDDVYDGVELVLDGLSDVTICGLGKSREDVEFVADPRYASVFKLVDCSDISFMNLTAGHTERGECVGDVVEVNSGKSFVFYNVDFYGCGVNGIGAHDGFSEIRVFDSSIHDCSNGPLYLYDGSGAVHVLNTTMYGSSNAGYYGEGSFGVYFQKCDFGVYESFFLNPMDEDYERYISMFQNTFSDMSEYYDYDREW